MLRPAQFFKCLSDETRLAATLLIKQEGELCVCELVTALEDSQPKISRHLAQLRNCEILDDARRGQWVYYAISPALPYWARDILNAATEGNAAQLKTFKANLAAMKNRPQCC
ncbi:metalloregulator ArsR/SmtB family transcription factor [Litorivivens sp.]|uniref:metalloregulator ArsR/SmtB family transcription factor n=2 Tax=Litorivivens sp. TaxID=2020868 RepID=UPI0035678094